MGRRKSTRRKVPTKLTEKLATVFDCPFCCAEKSCHVTMDRKSFTAEIRCHTCSESYHTVIHSLSCPIDVYSDWIDACEEANVKLKNYR